MLSAMRLFTFWPDNVSGLGRRQAPLFIGAVVLVFFTLAGMGGLAVYLRDLEVQAGQRTAQNLSSVVADQTDRAMQTAWSVISAVVDKLHREGVNSDATLKSAASAKDVQALVNDRAPGDTFLDSVFILSADGRGLDAGADIFSSLSGRYTDDFLEATRGGDDNTVFVSAPFQSKTAGTWQLSLSKRISANNGNFLGTVTGIVKLASFQGLLDRVPIGDHGSLSVFGDDGSIIACFPQREITLGRGVADGPVYTNFISHKIDGVTWLKNPADGVDRLLAVVHSTKFPVASVVAIAMSDIVAGWDRQAEILAVCAALIVVAIGLGAVRLAVQVERLAAAREREAMQAQMAIQYRQFQNATDNISQGLALYDRDNVLIACNKRYAEIYGLPVNLTGPRLAPTDSLPLRGGRAFGKVISTSRARNDGAIMTIHELPDGRFISQRRKRLDKGGWVSTHEDISERRRTEDKIREMATIDALTGLSNRFEFKQQLEQRLSEIDGRTGNFAVLYLDLDNFKSVNDTLGHTIGDKLLKIVAERIRAAVQEEDTVARLGGDEFAIIHYVDRTPGNVAHLARSLISSLKEPFTIDGDIVEIGASIGISLAPQDSVDSDELLRTADMALFHAKIERGVHMFFQPSMDEQVQTRRQLQSDLRAALAEKQFSLSFQPVVSVPDRTVKSFEALIRWDHPERGEVSPSEFIPLAEENGLIVQIGQWVIQEACLQAAKWPQHIQVAVNVSAVQFKAPGLIESIAEALETSGIDGSRLIVEVTESVMIRNPEQAIATLHAIRSIGISVAMDDFGTGYSSLSYFRRFPFDKIKIDRSFISEIDEREDSAAIVRAAVGLAKALGMEAVAEGVESEEQFARVGVEGCALAQGFLFSRPMPADEVCAFLRVEPREAVDRLVARTQARQDVARAPAPAGVAQFPLKRRDGTIIAASVPFAKATGS